ncbi:MAG: hypothetical protein ABI542_03965 [Gemmatimonadota bacterium]
MLQAGCHRVRGRSAPGDILFHAEGGALVQFRCPTLSKAGTRDAVRAYKESSFGGAGVARATTGYFVLTVVSTQYCTQIDEYSVVNGVWYWNRSYWDTGSCQWLDSIEVEWIGQQDLAPDPWSNYCCSGGSGDPPPPPPLPPPPPPPPDSGDATVVPWLDQDSEMPWSPPDCFQTQTEPGDIWWCQGSQPSGKNLTRVNAAITRMRQLGGMCAVLADSAEALLARGTLRLHPGGGSGYTGRDASGSYMTINQVFATHGFDANNPIELEDNHVPSGYFVTLQFMLAHEAEHLIAGNSGHIGSLAPNKWKMQHTTACDDIANN